mgnify:CR=1 FL=1
MQRKKRSVDARHKSGVSFVYTVALMADGEAEILKTKSNTAEPYTPPEAYTFPYGSMNMSQRPVVVGAGPAGLFAALCLAEAGLRPVLLERGKPVEARKTDVERFWKTGKLDEDSRRLLADEVLERLEKPERYEGQRRGLRVILQDQARHLTTFLRGERASYEPFTVQW